MNYDDSDDYEDDQYFNHSYTIFQSNANRMHITLYDVKDAIDCCSDILDDSMRSSCYHQFGVDGNMAEKYYNRVDSMERQYYFETIDEPAIPGSVYRHDTKENENQNRRAAKKPMRKWFLFGNDHDDEVQKK